MLKVEIENARQNLSFEHGAGPLEFGRGANSGCERCVVEDLAVSRDQLRIQSLSESRVRVENLSERVAAMLGGGRRIAPGEKLEETLPLQLVVGATQIRLSTTVVAAPSSDDIYASVAPPVDWTSAGDSSELAAIRDRLATNEKFDTETLIPWFETVVNVQQAAATSAEFYQQTAQAVVELVGLDEGLVLVRTDDDRWSIAAHHGGSDDDGDPYSHRILDFVVRERRTFYRELSDLSPTASLANVSAAVASPIFGADRRTVVGVVYGRRGMESMIHGRPIRPVEAHLVQVLASAVGAGLQRMEKEAEASRWRVQLESFFTPRLVEELDRNPRMLEANERTVTVLFADIRGFTDCTARLPAADALRLVGHVMDHLSTIVHEHDGTIVDYYGDGLMAMWNAPLDQHDHANRATNTALDMLAGLPTFGRDWQERLDAPLRIGVGINTGSAVVGNVGSQRKFKYGALGLTINLAQRIETVTKLVGFPALCSGSTRETVHTRARLVRVGRCLLSGALEPTDLYVVLAKRDRTLPTKSLNAQTAALAAFEAGDWSRAVELVEEDEHLATLSLGRLVVDRATELRDRGAQPDDAVFDLRTK